MAEIVAPDFEAPEVGTEIAKGTSYYSGTSVFEYEDEENDIWSEEPIPADQTTRLTLEERLEAIEQALNL